MKKIEIAKELVRIARQLVAIQFNTKKEMEQYKKNHNVRKDTKLTVKDNKSQKKDTSTGTGHSKKQMRKQIQDKVSKMDKDTREKQALNNKNQQVLDVLADDEYFKVRWTVATNPHTSAKTLDKLSNEDWSVCVQVASNPNTSAKTLDKLSSDDNPIVRQNVAKHPNTSSKTLDRLSYDWYHGVKEALAHNPNYKGKR